MSDPGQRCVCDLTLIWRIRLLCGLYNSRAAPRWRRCAQAYCLAVTAVYFFYIYSVVAHAGSSAFVFLSMAFEYLFSVVISLWTGDEYMHSFFTQNNVTDVTLDSRMVFGQFQKRIKQACILSLIYMFVILGLGVTVWHDDDGFVSVLAYMIGLVFVHGCGSSVSALKLLIMGLFNARILVLKRRLQRYGFRVVGRAPPQPYCHVYDEIIQGLSATDRPLKFMLFFDLILGCSKMISHITFGIYTLYWQLNTEYQIVACFLYYSLTLAKVFVVSFGHVALLESADAHCSDMAVFIATQLIKTPTAEERRRMHAFLNALERRGARYRVLRGLTLDARLVLRVLGFCSAQVILFINIINAKKG